MLQIMLWKLERNPFGWTGLKSECVSMENKTLSNFFFFMRKTVFWTWWPLLEQIQRTSSDIPTCVENRFSTPLQFPSKCQCGKGSVVTGNPWSFKSKSAIVESVKFNVKNTPFPCLSIKEECGIEMFHKAVESNPKYKLQCSFPSKTFYAL